ncbi:hypothetical protein [Sideroxydans sp. CL21]|uniref:hypothetical protein n=1 Tax=Sideroxydans sp. CL21 TaxID=2600596 RepID=UPI0024BC0343|nr:hypothetical protein [Sideroxydans sp. CL21]
MMALEQVIFMSRKDAENSVNPRWAVISISGLDPARLREGWQSVLRLEFDDIDPDPKALLADDPYILFGHDHAKQIIEFAHKCNESGVVGIVVHCHAGISRSAAVSKWIAERFGLDFPADYMLYNKHVYETLCRASL